MRPAASGRSLPTVDILVVDGVATIFENCRVTGERTDHVIEVTRDWLHGSADEMDSTDRNSASLLDAIDDAIREFGG